jgi:hypothetical protein
MNTLNQLLAGLLMQMPPIALPPIPQVQYVPLPPHQQYVAPSRYYQYQGPHQQMSEDQERARIMAEARAFCTRWPNNEACHRPDGPVR